MVKVILNGINGKMGQIISNGLKNDDQIEFLKGTDIEDDLAAEIKEHAPDVVVDFTNPASRMKNCETIITSGAHAVIGTTGFTLDDLTVLSDLSTKYGKAIIIAPNFSISAVLMMEFAKKASHFMKQAEIIEMHHDQKHDAPSGTAIKTAKAMSETNTFDPPKRESDETIEGARGADFNNIKLHSVRLPGFVATQEIIFGGVGERLMIKSDAINRECYVEGVNLAVKKIIEMKGLTYGLEDLLQL